MKLRQAAFFSYLASASAFSVVSRATTTIGSASKTLFSAVSNDFGTAVQDGVSIFDQLEIKEGELALGVKPDEVLKYIGTREDLIAKTLTDIPSFDRLQAKAEVDKFLMDYDMLNLYIQYGKELEKNPNFVVPADKDFQDDGLFSFRNIVGAYIAYVIATTIPNVFRGYVAKQEVAGQWTPTNIQFLDDWIERTSPEATARVLQRAANAAGDMAQQVATDASQAATDAIVPTADTLQTAVDAVQTGF